MEVLRADGVKIVFAVAAGFNQSCDAQESQMVTDGGLALAQSLAQGGNMQFTFPHQIHEDAKASLVGQELEYLNEILLELV